MKLTISTERDKLGRFSGNRVIITPWEDRFWGCVNKAGPVPIHRPELGPCWLWEGTVNKRYGYGYFHYDRIHHRAHVFIYRKMVGDIPEGLELDHLCRTRNCVNYVSHLEPVTPQENTFRGFSPAGINHRATHCVNGHEFIPCNMYVYIRSKTGNVNRVCKICAMRRSAEYLRRLHAGKRASLLRLR